MLHYLFVLSGSLQIENLIINHHKSLDSLIYNIAMFVLLVGKNTKSHGADEKSH